MKRRKYLLGSVYDRAMVPQELVGLVLAAIVLVTAGTIIYNFGPFLTGGGRAQIAGDNFNSLAIELQRMASKPDTFIADESFPYSLGDAQYSLIGFDSGSKVTTQGVLCLGQRQKPTECGTKVCICLFDDSMNPTPGTDYTKNVKGLVGCRRIDGIATISSVPDLGATPLEKEGVPSASGEYLYVDNVGDIKPKKALIANLPISLQSSEYLFLMKSGKTFCGAVTPYGSSAELYAKILKPKYENTPLYLEKAVIDGNAHLVISNAGKNTKERMEKAYALIGISVQSVSRQISAGDYARAILDTKAWLLASSNPTAEDQSTMLFLQARAFQKISQMDKEQAKYLLESVGLTAPIPAQSDRYAGLYAIKAYKAAIEKMPKNEQKSFAVLEGLRLCEQLSGFTSEIDSELLPFFKKQAEGLPSGTTAGDFIKARQAVQNNEPEAEKLLSEFVQSSLRDENEKEAMYLLAQVQEKNSHYADSISTYQKAIIMFGDQGQAMSDGKTITARDEINRICKERINEQEIYEICTAVSSGAGCKQVTLSNLPKEACAQDLIDQNRCIADPIVTDAFTKAQTEASRIGKTLQITSAYRTIEQQKTLYEASKKGIGNEAAKPSCIAPHVTGRAIDVTFKGENMGAGSASDMSSPNRKLLEEVMCKAGFIRYKGEYWHYEIGTNRGIATYPERCNA